MKPTYRFYLVDDDPVVLRLLATILESEGHTVRSSESSVRALDEIRSLKPDCVVLDIMMPGLDGLELCRRLRADKEMADTRIVVLTGFAEQQAKIDRQIQRESFGPVEVRSAIVPDLAELLTLTR